MDPDGYPDDDELEKIENWPWDDFPGLVEFVRERWRWSDRGWKEEGDELHISTGGWSGNESLISAMEANFPFWAVHWESSRRGGHYVFQKPRITLSRGIPVDDLIAKITLDRRMAEKQNSPD